VARDDLDRRRRLRLQQRYGLLLAALWVLFFVQGALPTREPWGEVLITALTAGTLVLALRAAEARTATVLVLGIVSVVLVLAVMGAALAGVAAADAARLTDGLLIAVAPAVVARGVIRSRREQSVVTVQDVLGVLCVYLLLGMLWAYVYGALDRLGDGPFFADGAAATTSNCLYFSFTTLTTVGYGDLTARSELGHTIAVCEALVGQIYLVTVVAVLVSNLGASGRPTREVPGRRGR